MSSVFNSNELKCINADAKYTVFGYIRQYSDVHIPELIHHVCLSFYYCPKDVFYNKCMEGLVLFIILWWFSRIPRPVRATSGLFLFFYGIFRFLIEFVRMPDQHIGYIAFNWLTLGQLLSIPMIIFGMIFGRIVGILLGILLGLILRIMLGIIFRIVL